MALRKPNTSRIKIATPTLQALRFLHESLEETHISLADLCISGRKIHIFLEEISKWKREICISSRDSCKLGRGICISSEELACFFLPTTKRRAG